jgi:hypothetical protein
VAEQKLDAGELAYRRQRQASQIPKLPFIQRRASVPAGFFGHRSKARRAAWVLSEAGGVIVIAAHHHSGMLPDVPDRRRGVRTIVHKVSKNPQLIEVRGEGLQSLQVRMQVRKDQNPHRSQLAIQDDEETPGVVTPARQLVIASAAGLAVSSNQAVEFA